MVGDRLYVFDWEMASSVYLKYYETASIASNIIIKENRLDLAEKFIDARKALLEDKELKEFQSIFIDKLLPQRMLGDLWDVLRGEDGLDKAKKLVQASSLTMVFDKKKSV